MTMRKVKIPKGIDFHALNAWWYVGETIKACKDVGKDYKFMDFVLHLRREYPREYAFYIALTRGYI